jgi:hypothetical protein
MRTSAAGQLIPIKYADGASTLAFIFQRNIQNVLKTGI